MTKIVKGARIVHKRINETPTIPINNDHTSGSWLNTDIYEGEVCLKLSDYRAYTRMSGDTHGDIIVEFVLIDPQTNKIRIEQLPTSLLGSVIYQGTWNASTGNPPTATPEKGWYYVVSTSGTTNLDGIDEWKVSDWAIYNGTFWERVDNSEEVIDLTPFLRLSGGTMTGDLNGVNINLSGELSISGMSENTTNYIVYYDSVSKKISFGDSSSLTPVYDSMLDDTLTVPQTMGGILSGTTVGELTGKTFSTLFDMLLFPTIQPSITVNKSATLTPSLITPVEVGSTLSPTLTANFNTGTIKNGGSNTTVNLVGNANSYIFRLPNTSSDGIYNVGSNSQLHTFSNYIATFGNNTWSVTISHDVGLIPYYDSKGVESHIFDANRVAANITANSTTVVAVRYAWWGSGASGSYPTTSSNVRALTSKTFLSTSNTGTFTITIPSGSEQVYFFVPSGKNVIVRYVESSNADVTGAFSTSPISVNDANGTAQSYTAYLSTTSNYPSTANYTVIVS